MSKSVVFHVKGIPGSGKTYLCKHLPPGVKCLDTDDYFTAAYRQLFRKRHGAVSDRRLRELAARLLRKEVARHKFVVVVGVTIPVTNATRTYFIKQSVTELKKAFKRVIAREIAKYRVLQKKTVVDRLMKLPPGAIIQQLRHAYHIGVVDILAGVESYISMYKQAHAFETRNKLSILSQSAIIRDIKKQAKVRE